MRHEQCSTLYILYLVLILLMKLRLRKKLSKLPKTTCKLVTEPRFKPKFLTLKSALLTTTPNCFLQRATQKPDLQFTYCYKHLVTATNSLSILVKAPYNTSLSCCPRHSSSNLLPPVLSPQSPLFQTTSKFLSHVCLTFFLLFFYATNLAKSQVRIHPQLRFNFLAS